MSVSENEKIDSVQKIIDGQTVENSEKICLNCCCVIDKQWKMSSLWIHLKKLHHQLINVNLNSHQTIKLVLKNLCKQENG